MLKITRETAEITANIFPAAVSGRYIFNMPEIMRPPSKLATGNKFTAAYIILLKNAKSRTELELLPDAFNNKKIKPAEMMLNTGPPSAIKISVLYGASPPVIILTPQGVISALKISAPRSFIKIICPASCITIQPKIITE